MTHWTPPNRGKTSTGTTATTGTLPTMSTPTACVVPANGGTAVPRKSGKNVDPTGGGKGIRNNKALPSPPPTYGPTGIRSTRMFHGPGCPDCGTTSLRTMPSAFGPQDQFRAGAKSVRGN